MPRDHVATSRALTGRRCHNSTCARGHVSRSVPRGPQVAPPLSIREHVADHVRRIAARNQDAVLSLLTTEDLAQLAHVTFSGDHVVSNAHVRSPCVARSRIHGSGGNQVSVQPRPPQPNGDRTRRASGCHVAFHASHVTCARLWALSSRLSSNMRTSQTSNCACSCCMCLLPSAAPCVQLPLKTTCSSNTYLITRVHT